jgi:sugar phosphate isomerase/epimerase
MNNTKHLLPRRMEDIMSKKDYATQIWPFRESFGKDMPGTLEKLAGLGFAGVELCRWFDWTDMFDKWTAQDIKAVSQRVGLEVVSAHIPYYMIKADKLAELADFCDIVGMKFAIVASLPEDQYSSKTGLLQVAKDFNQATNILKSKGIRIGYHCHGGDFKPVEGEIPWDLLFDNTGPEVVMQLDIGNALHGGVDPIHYLKKYPGRATLVHLKEYDSKVPPAAIGDGEIDWNQVIELCEDIHQPVWYIIEQEEKEYDPWHSAEKSLKYLRSIGW